MCLKVVTNGDGIAEGTHVSVFVYIMRGKFNFHLNGHFKEGYMSDC